MNCSKVLHSLVVRNLIGSVVVHRKIHLTTLNMVKAKKYVYASAFVGEPKLSDLKLVEEELSALKDGEILVEAEFWSVDPYMRPYMNRYPVGSDMIGGQVAKVTESKSLTYKRGDYVFGQLGWRTHTVVDTKTATPMDIYKLPDMGAHSPSLGLGILGMPGNTAYFGFLEICKPKSGETVVVTGAGGAVGSVVGQIAKIKGCRVIGFAGTDEKCRWLESELGFDVAINYKQPNVYKLLKEAAPKGVDCYFDNVGGELSSVIINQMNLFGRISVCGAISAYNADPKAYPQVAILQPTFVFTQLLMEGFIVHRWAGRWMEGLKQNYEWIQQGKLKYHETVTQGFENMPQAFIDMLNGKNTGKAIVKA